MASFQTVYAPDGPASKCVAGQSENRCVGPFSSRSMSWLSSVATAHADTSGCGCRDAPHRKRLPERSWWHAGCASTGSPDSCDTALRGTRIVANHGVNDRGLRPQLDETGASSPVPDHRLRIIAGAGGSVQIARIREAILARQPDIRWDRRYPMKVLADNGIVEIRGTTARLVESLDADQIASLLSALDERAVRTTGLRVEDASWRADQAEWRRLRLLVVERDGEDCAVPGCDRCDDLQLDHIWRGSLLAAIGWSPSAINDPINLQLLCPVHHADKTANEAQLIAAYDARDDG